MKSLFLISKASLNQIEQEIEKFNKETIILFEETYQTIYPTNSMITETITSAQIAQDFLKATDKKTWSNNLEKAKIITNNFDENFEIFLLYSDKIINKYNFDNKIILIIEENKQIDEIDCVKITLTPPSPIIIEKILNKYPGYKIETINEEDENLFQINYYYENIN